MARPPVDRWGRGDQQSLSVRRKPMTRCVSDHKVGFLAEDAIDQVL